MHTLRSRATRCSAAVALVLAMTARGAASTAQDGPIDPNHDYHSFSNPQQLRVEHANLALEVDFTAKRLAGTVVLRVKRIAREARTLILDSRGLSVRAVWLVRDQAKPRPLPYRFGTRDAKLGTPLQIDVSAVAEPVFEVRISYLTDPQASGLQWVAPEQTAGKQHPFLFSQSQAIHARSWIPLQDTPAVRMTYEAKLQIPTELVAVMSAAGTGGFPDEGLYQFRMEQAIPSYLIALGVGNLEYKQIGRRTGVYAEPAIAEAAAREFADTESMLKTSERLFGPYRWERYDLLILPPSFPFGGMENPRLSFITPTVIAGDKSLTSLIAHELAHSWSGNLVTNATWRDLWLNEGFTVFLERRIMGALYGERRRDMEDVLGLQSLQGELKTLPEQDQVLAIDLRGRDPDDVFSEVPYEKGRLFLGWLESKFGRGRFDTFLRGYFDHFAFQSITTEQFLQYLNDNLLKDNPKGVSAASLKEWIEGPGLPADAVLPRSDAFKKVEERRQAWLEARATVTTLGVADKEKGRGTVPWTTHEWLHFLDNLPGKLSPEQLAELDAAFKLTDTGNSEIAHSWLKVAIRNRYEPALPRLERYLTSIGRRKLIKPLYEELMKSDWGREFAQRVYTQARPTYHPIAVSTLDEIVRKPE